MEAVILRQSEQEQTKESTRPGLVVGFVGLEQLVSGLGELSRCRVSYEADLDGAAEAGCGCGWVVFAT